jgi:aminopeptidase-like protein
VPYLTSYFETNWGFCLADRVLKALPREGEYEVHIDSRLAPGSLCYGEAYLPSAAGRHDGDVLISSHTCHPSLANDNLSGIAVAVTLYQVLASRPRRFGYRFLFLPATIGPIVWLSDNEAKLPAVRAGLVLSGLGDGGSFTYKRSRRGNAAVDRVAAHVLRNGAGTLEDFSPYGYDERQYCSPGYNLPVGRLSRTPFGTYLQYHTSADDLSFISARALGEAAQTVLRICEGLECDRRYRNLSPKGEPQLGRRGLYGAIGGRIDKRSLEKDLLWMLNWSDGEHGLLDIAAKAGEPLARMAEAARLLEASGLLEELQPDV